MVITTIDYINMNKGDKQARAKEEYKRFEATKYREAGDYRPDSYTNGSTFHKIRINDMEVKPSLAKTIDQLVLLSKSIMWNETMTLHDKLMAKYHNLLEEEQIRTLPDKVKIEIAKFIDGFKQQSEYYESYQKHPREAMRINDESDKTTTVIDTDYFKEVKSDVKIDFPYENIAEIMKDKKLNTKEKIAMCDRYLEVKIGFHNNLDAEDGQVVNQSEPNAYNFEVADIDMELPKEMEEKLIESMDIPKTQKSPKEMFLTLCAKFPKRFVKANKGKSPKIGWQKSIKGVIHEPTLITVDPIEAETYAHECLMDSTIKHKMDSYFVKGLNACVYFIRTTKE